MDIKAVIREAETIRSELLKNPELAQHIDQERSYIPVPKVGTGEIKIIFIGQDPTVRNERSRAAITTVLNLDDPSGSLYRYLSFITDKLGYSIEENVYATNLLKCFYKVPPAAIPEGVSRHATHWLKLLKAELAQYPEALVITLGEPVLQALITPGSKKVRDYWGYQKNGSADINQFKGCAAADNALGRLFFPFPHQPSMRKEFYWQTIDAYLAFVRLQP